MANSPHTMKIVIPKKALEDASEDGKSVAPSMGDEVMLPDVMGVIESEDGDNYNVRIKSVAGCDCEEPEAESPAEDKAEPTEESVMKMAKMEDGE